MTFTGNETHDLPLDTAAKWTKNYRDANPGATIAHLFGKGALMDVLGQDGCVGARIYYALDDDNKKHLIVVGTDVNGNDMYQGKILDRSFPCPTTCSAANPLNS